MHAILSSLFDGIREDFGYPVKLVRLLEERKDICVDLRPPSLCIDARRVVRWDQLGEPPAFPSSTHKRGILFGWKWRESHHYGSFQLSRPEFNQLGHCDIKDDWECDISEVQGFSNSKSNLEDFTSTDMMVETNSLSMIDEISHAKLAKNLDHKEIRIIHSPGADYFSRFQWDGRLFLMNHGGSHHFAAAKYIAKRLEAPVPLRGQLRTYSLNAVAIASLRRDFEMFVISDETTIALAFHEAMTAFRATWLWHYMPRPFENTIGILLPKNEPRSMRVAALLKQAGVTDLGQHLAFLATKNL